MIAIISDIHGNMEALQAVLDEVRSAKAILCCGDVVGYGPDPNVCCELLRQCGVLSARGNHDHTCATLEGIDAFTPMAARAAVWTHRELTKENGEWLCSLPLRLDYDGISLVHGCPGSPSDMLGTYVLEPWINETAYHCLLASVPGQRLVLGHTHIPMRHGKVINPGSVGLPRDGDPRPSYLTIGDGTGRQRMVAVVKQFLGVAGDRVTLRRVDYENRATAARIEQEPGLPEDLALLCRHGARLAPCEGAIAR